MLVLSRERDEEIELEIEGFPGVIKIAYLGQLERFKNNRTISEARIGIQAPLSVRIIRGELKHENQQSKVN